MAHALRIPNGQASQANRQPVSQPIPPSQENGNGRSFVGFLNAIAGSSSRDPYVSNAARHLLAKSYGTEYESSTYPVVTKGPMGEITGSAGGYLVPLDFTYKLLSVISEESFIYPRATRVPMASATMTCPKAQVETAQSAGISPFFGGISFTWGNSQAPTETEPTYSALDLKAWDLLGYATVSDQWLSDIGERGEDYLVHLFGAAAAWQAEYAFLRGTGSANLMPLGILNAPGTISFSRTTGSDIKISDIAGMAAKMLPFGWKRSVWACSPTCLTKIVALSDYFINIDTHGEGGQCGSLLGRPLFVTDKLPAMASAGSLIFFDPSLYIIGERQQILVDVSGDPGFRNMQTTFRVWLRLDGKPQLSNTITLPDTTTSVSAYVSLSA